LIYTGDCIVSEAAAHALKRAGVRAVARGTNIVSQEDLFVALLQEPNLEIESVVSAVPRLRALCTALAETQEKIISLEARRLCLDVWPSKPLEKAIELAAKDGRITAEGLLMGLMAEPITHLLKLLAKEYRSDSAIFEDH
jgi:ATP-dependent Clp protease ATP-binding subunit ClpA